MNKQNLIIYKLPIFFEILNEIKKNFNFDIHSFSSKKEIEELNKENLGNFLILIDTDNEKYFIENQNKLVVKNFPLKLSNLIEKINILFLKQNYVSQSNLIVGDYNLDINSREIYKDEKRLKLTEREANLILYLNKSKNQKTIADLQKNVWGHSSDLETHTVETHIYRLRKKISEIFNDEDFILSTKDGYKIQ